MLIDEFDDTTIWATHTQADGSDIGGVPPAAYGYQLIPSRKRAARWLLWSDGTTDTTGEQYPAWMLYPKTPRPILPNTGNLNVYFDFVLGGGKLAGMNVLETDTLLVVDGWKYNGSVQYNQSSGGFQIANAAGAWETVGIYFGELDPSVKYRTQIFYEFDLTARTISVKAISLNDDVEEVPSALQNVAASDTSEGGKVSPWLTGAYWQLQMGSLPNAAPWSVRIKRIRNEWY